MSNISCFKAPEGETGGDLVPSRAAHASKASGKKPTKKQNAWEGWLPNSETHFFFFGAPSVPSHTLFPKSTLTPFFTVSKTPYPARYHPKGSKRQSHDCNQLTQPLKYRVTIYLLVWLSSGYSIHLRGTPSGVKRLSPLLLHHDTLHRRCSGEYQTMLFSRRVDSGRHGFPGPRFVSLPPSTE